METIKDKVEEFVERGILIKTKRGYVYPNWLQPYIGDKKLMKGILELCKHLNKKTNRKPK